MSNVIITSECEFCKYGTVDDTDKARVMVHCDYRDKTYFFGQCVPCEDFEKRRIENE